jgi:hypothetical protein
MQHKLTYTMPDSENMPIVPASERERTFNKDWVLTNDLLEMDALCEEVSKELIALGWDADKAGMVDTQIRELITNAMSHGNGQVFRTKGELDEDWIKRLSEALNSANAQGKRVKIKATLSPQSAKAEIQDEGIESDEFWKRKQRGIPETELTNWYSGHGLEIAEAGARVVFQKNQQGILAIYERSN